MAAWRLTSRLRPSGFWGSPFRCLPVAFVSAESSSFVLRVGRHFGFRQTPPLRSPKALSPLRPPFGRPQPPFLLWLSHRKFYL